MLTMFLTLLVMGCVHSIKVPEDKPVESEASSEFVGGKYDGTLVTIEGSFRGTNYTRYVVRYVEDNETLQGYFLQEFRPALDWVKENTPSDAAFFNWWDYGHMIRGYAGRDSVLFTPSEEILWSVSSGQWDEDASGELANNDRVERVARALLASNASVLYSAMEGYGSDYVMVSRLDESITKYWLRRFEEHEYITSDEVNELASRLILFRMLDDEEVEGFRQVYSDSVVKIYERANENL